MITETWSFGLGKILFCEVFLPVPNFFATAKKGEFGELCFLFALHETIEYHVLMNWVVGLHWANFLLILPQFWPNSGRSLWTFSCLQLSHHQYFHDKIWKCFKVFVLLLLPPWTQYSILQKKGIVSFWPRRCEKLIFANMCKLLLLFVAMTICKYFKSFRF